MRFKDFMENEADQQKLNWLDKAQLAGDVAGVVGDVAWGAGAPIDAANAAISAARTGKAALSGDWGGVKDHGFNTLARGISTVPVVGDAIGKSTLAAKYAARAPQIASNVKRGWQSVKPSLQKRAAQSRLQRGQQGVKQLNLPPEILGPQ
jgi:hypothetical protein